MTARPDRTWLSPARAPVHQELEPVRVRALYHSLA
jgi:hypothetical protein